ncbi:uncharacterized protein FOMMEDRAFT_24724 [Fomitiporia mediterranea MF3/22]|uniref:uncharacterized protein n=1 Tax=Fomitiporia mediterranea (strain MF3/22) TaxID=694068 RepID=UPI0004408A3A|nr:uncharacterized protein FOMMEDRAFT_24724 [Fomitiporia mediterranea MF3/22]EJD07316.1 hypothetical protein FOMMEDRAFT_24724 [Fomitiporia mediterranea MF3/22]
MEFQNLAKAVASIPHVGQVLAVMLTVAVGIYEELKTLDSKLEAQKRLGEDANFIISTIAMHSKTLKAKDQNYLRLLARQLQQVEKVAKDIQRHIWEASGARERHIRKYGKLPANVYDALTEPAKVHVLKQQLEEAKTQLLKRQTDFTFLKMMEGDGSGSEPPPVYAETFEEEEKEPEPKAFGPVRWVSMKEFVASPGLNNLMVPVCQSSETEDGVVWYIARVPHVGGIRKEPGKFSPGRGTFFGFKRESLPTKDLNYDILIADPGTVQWERTSGRFSEEQLCSRPVTSCRENDGTELVIARALAREHMHIDIFGKMFLQPGKASPKLDGAYVIAGEKEVKVKEYEVLVYAKPRKKLIL